jgi:hypothetical protein
MRTLLFAAVIALASIGCEKSSNKADKAEVGHDLPEMSVDEVAAGIDAKQLTLVDCNSEKTRKQDGVIAGAILVEDSETFPATILPADKATKLLFYCGGPG